MPTAPRKPCRYPGCHELVTGGYCDAHARERDRSYDERRGNDPRLSLAVRIRNSARWQHFRTYRLGKDPICQHPHCDRPSTDVHHVVKIIDNPDLAFVESNTRCLCALHHSQEERTGSPPAMISTSTEG